jgi:TPR repeat protein
MSTTLSPDLLKAAEDGDLPSQYAVGWCYANGKGVSRNPVESEKWWRKAAEADVPGAQRCLGFFWSEILGLDERLRWTREAANSGEPEAQKYLGFITFWGGPVDRDRVSGMKWLLLGTEQNRNPILMLWYKNLIGLMQLLMTRDEIYRANMLVQQSKQAKMQSAAS